MIGVILGEWYRDSETGFFGKCTSILFSAHNADEAYLEGPNHARWVAISRLTQIDKPVNL